MNEEKEIRLDRLRFTKNTTSSRLTLLAILFDILFFVSIYKSDVGNYYYTVLIGGSIIYNLCFLLAAFLASEGVKSYKAGYSWLLIVLGVLQIVRIFILPVRAHAAVVSLSGVDTIVMGDAQFTRVVIYLVLSAVCLFASAVVNLNKSRQLAGHLAALEANKV